MTDKIDTSGLTGHVVENDITPDTVLATALRSMEEWEKAAPGSRAEGEAAERATSAFYALVEWARASHRVPREFEQAVAWNLLERIRDTQHPWNGGDMVQMITAWMAEVGIPEEEINKDDDEQ